MIKSEKGLNYNVYKAMFDGFKTEKIKVCLLNSANNTLKWFDIKNVSIVNDNYLQDITYLSTFLPTTLYNRISSEIEDVDFDIKKFFDYERNDSTELREWVKNDWKPFKNFTNGDESIIKYNIQAVKIFLYKIKKTFYNWDWGDLFESIPTIEDENGIPYIIDTNLYSSADMLYDILVEEFVKIFLMILNRNVFYSKSLNQYSYDYDILPMTQVEKQNEMQVDLSFISNLDLGYLKGDSPYIFSKFVLNIFDATVYYDSARGMSFDIVSGYNDVINNYNKAHPFSKMIHSFIEMKEFDETNVDKINVEETELNINYDLINIVSHEEYFTFDYINFYYTEMKADEILKKIYSTSAKELCDLYGYDENKITKDELSKLIEKSESDRKNFNANCFFLSHKLNKFYNLKDNSWKVVLSKDSILKLKQST